MNKSRKIVAILAVLLLSAGCARNTTHYISIDEALNSPQAKEVLDPNIKLYFARGAGNAIKSGLVSNKKTNSANKTDREACIWAFLSAVKQFQERAYDMGGTKVTNLISFYKKQPYSSQENFECHAGTVITGVALKGDIAR
ncbi:excinuclease ABC subunit A [Suttonella sp. R2A3]|uniref:excinuclease ABC subunit A n=1 Tax=Suttonella sp. R2A3 TaxID=2908648 RepID=UPI001F1BB55A|nr:excinuclease ABC subunit A [Suttonella sp. R2A3]UJF23678.1 excinuclease ABC subunit A [Suttonella sp. R2A3]